ncbi:MAG: hypothetical protein Q7V62_09405 [Actinomycetota bacterium]|nr:hypothetical protein [Actinomycetota bacterium]
MNLPVQVRPPPLRRIAFVGAPADTQVCVSHCLRAQFAHGLEFTEVSFDELPRTLAKAVFGIDNFAALHATEKPLASGFTPAQLMDAMRDVLSRDLPARLLIGDLNLTHVVRSVGHAARGSMNVVLQTSDASLVEKLGGFEVHQVPAGDAAMPFAEKVLTRA